LKNFKIQSIVLSLVMLFGFVFSPLTTFASSTVSVEDYESLNVSPMTIVFEDNKERIFQLEINGDLYEYHEVKDLIDGKEVTQITTYFINEFGDKEKVDYYETGIDYLEVSNELIQPMCGPPCLFVAVVVVRQGTSYLLKRSLTSATLRTVASQPATRVAPVISSYTPHTVNVSSRTFTITKSNMQHILQRHHQTYYHAGAGNPVNQTFFYDNISTGAINNIATQALRQNATLIDDYIRAGKGYINVPTTYNGVTYQVGAQLTGSRQITNIYPTITYIAP